MRGAGVLEWGVAVAPLDGASACGDIHLVREFPGGALVAVVDALGHGPEAERAAREAVEILAPVAHEPIADLLDRCHRSRQGRRGVVMSLASFDGMAHVMTWTGVGNVEGVLLRENQAKGSWRRTLLTHGGIVGGDLPAVRPQAQSLATGDLLIFATDGVRRDFADELDHLRPARDLAAELLARHGKGTDDALILVARYRGSLP